MSVFKSYDEMDASHRAAYDLGRSSRDSELEQAERERDEAKHQRDTLERIAREQAELKHELGKWRSEHEAQLAKVPALIKALRYYRGSKNPTANVALTALAAFEQEQNQ